MFFLNSVHVAAMLSMSTERARRRTSSHPRMIQYEFQHLTLPDYLPVINPPRREEASGPGEKPGDHRQVGRSYFDPRITIISNPPHPDNSRLTLNTENAPSGSTPLENLKVPDLISGIPTVPPAAPFFSSPMSNGPRSLIPSSEQRSAASSPKPLEAQKLATTEKPTTAPPSLSPNNKSGVATASAQHNPAQSPKITALTADPVPLNGLIPEGTRAGAFSVSPTGAVQGSAGGAPGAPTDVSGPGPRPHGKARDAVESRAPGGATGGNSALSPATSPAISVSGHAGAAGISAGTLAPLRAEDLVYEVNPLTPKTPAPKVVVSSGPWGGGGLQIYGVLHGQTLYTVYLSMPGKNWILEFCARETPPQLRPAAGVVQIHIDPPLAPPVAMARFDFRRPTPVQGPANSMIILHGAIQEDGSLSSLVVIQGRDPISNAAACAAFSRWKFRPAQRAGTPVALEILVGIP